MRPRNLEKEQAIKTVALQLIASEGLENFSMQKLAAAANISPRTIYLKYADKEDLLIKLFIEEVLGAYEAAVLKGFEVNRSFDEGIKHIWQNSFSFFTENHAAFVLMRYGKSSPLLNKAYREKNIQQGHYFGPVHQFIKLHEKAGTIKTLPFDAHRALLFAPLMDLINEYFDYKERPEQIITPAVLMACCDSVIKGLLN
jgi:AcrR family transcriptional regulator